MVAFHKEEELVEIRFDTLRTIFIDTQDVFYVHLISTVVNCLTHIGKFYSLLMSTSIKTGILFTYHGVTGSGWNDGTGLIKKMYLQRELDDNRVAIIVFSIQDYERIAAGENFIDLFNRKLLDLRLDTSIDTYISPHEAELQLNQLSLSDQQE